MKTTAEKLYNKQELLKNAKGFVLGRKGRKLYTIIQKYRDDTDLYYIRSSNYRDFRVLMPEKELTIKY